MAEWNNHKFSFGYNWQFEYGNFWILWRNIKHLATKKRFSHIFLDNMRVQRNILGFIRTTQNLYCAVCGNICVSKSGYISNKRILQSQGFVYRRVLHSAYLLSFACKRFVKSIVNCWVLARFLTMWRFLSCTIGYCQGYVLTESLGFRGKDGATPVYTLPVPSLIILPAW